MSAVEIVKESVGESSEVLSYPERLQKFVNIGLQIDCKFQVGPEAKTAEVIEGHKIMFAVESPVFESMLYGDFKEATNSLEIHIPSDDPKVFKQLRQLIYCADRTTEMHYLSLSLEDTIALYRLCDKYLIKPLTDVCTFYIKSLLDKANDSNLIQLLSFADEFQIPSLLSSTWKLVHAHGYKFPKDVNLLKSSQFMEYINRASVSPYVNHFELCTAIESYLSHNNLIPKNLLDTRKQKDDEEEGMKHEIVESLFVCVNVVNLQALVKQNKRSPFKNIPADTFNKYMSNMKLNNKS